MKGEDEENHAQRNLKWIAMDKNPAWAYIGKSKMNIYVKSFT